MPYAMGDSRTPDKATPIQPHTLAWPLFKGPAKTRGSHKSEGTTQSPTQMVFSSPTRAGFLKRAKTGSFGARAGGCYRPLSELDLQMPLAWTATLILKFTQAPVPLHPPWSWNLGVPVSHFGATLWTATCQARLKLTVPCRTRVVERFLWWSVAAVS